MGTNIHRVLWFVLYYSGNWYIVTLQMGNNIHEVLVIDEYLYYRLYSIYGNIMASLTKWCY